MGTERVEDNAGSLRVIRLMVEQQGVLISWPPMRTPELACLLCDRGDSCQVLGCLPALSATATSDRINPEMHICACW